MTTGIIIQCHDKSTRLPKKLFKELNGITILENVVIACHNSIADKIIIATSTDQANDTIVSLFNKFSYKYPRLSLYRYHGSDSDVLSRYYNCATDNKLNTICRITSDCPLISKDIINLVIKTFLYYRPNIMDFILVDGLEVQCIDIKSLEKAHNEAKLDYEREHVFPFVYNHPEMFNIKHLNEVKFSIDEEKDYKLIKQMCIL